MNSQEVSQLTEKQNNILKVLKFVFYNTESVTSDIQKQTGLSVSTISRVVNELMQKNMIEVCGKEKIVKGRFPKLMQFNSNYGHIVHLDITPLGIHGCIADISGKIINKQHTEFEDKELSLDYLVNEIKRIFLSLKKSLAENILAAGISLPGIADENKRKVSRIPDITAFNDVDVFSIAEQALGIPVIINNLPGIAAAGERSAYHPYCNDFVYINIMQSVGIGAGIIINGRLIKGKDFIAGEAGDFYFDRLSFSSGRNDSIGRLEQYAGLGALYKRIKSLINEGGAKNLALLIKGKEELDLWLVEQSISAGDKDVEALYLDVLQVWVILIIDIVLLLNPEKIVLGGAVTENNTMTQRIINKMLTEELFINQQIELAKSGENAVFTGGIEVLRSYVFDNIIAKKATEN